MIIKSLELHNYRQHEHLKEAFDGNLIGILGPNGSGKSHFMDALEFSFAGSVPKQNKSDMLRWGAEEGSVTTVFEHNGVEGTIWRELHSTKATFTYGKDTKVTGITKVNKAIAEATGLDADICKQAVFVHQKEVDAVLFTEPSVRQMAWQRLCGLGEATATHKRLGEFISSLPELADYTEQIGEALTRIEEANSQLGEAQENMQITDMGGLQPEQLEAAIRQVAELRNTIQAGMDESSILAEDQKRLHAAQNSLLEIDGKLGAYLDDPAELLTAVTDRMNEAVRSLTASRQLHQYETEKAGVEQQLAALAVPHTEAEIQTATNRLADVNNTLAAAQGNLAMANQLLAAVQGTTNVSQCPLCRQAVSSNIAELASSNQSAATDAVNMARNESQVLTNELNAMKEALKQYEFTKAGLDRKLTSVTAQIEQVRSTITVQTSDEAVRELQAKVDELQTSVKTKQDLAMRKSGFDSQILTLNESIQQRSQRVEGLLNKAKELMVAASVADAGKLDERDTELQAQSAKCREVSEQVNRLKGQIAEIEKAIDNLNKTVKELRDREDKQAALKSVLDTLAAVRGWFHYSNGPQRVINSLLERITSGVNDFLEKFGAGFYAIPDFGTTSFKYWYTDGRIPPTDGYPPVSEMSGGEAVVLAVSFRFATYCLFASRIGLLTLDEPTVYLDDNNISRFCNLLQRVKELATDMNLQVFISTHEKPVIPFMDSTIKFGNYKTNEEDEDERQDGTDEEAV